MTYSINMDTPTIIFMINRKPKYPFNTEKGLKMEPLCLLSELE